MASIMLKGREIPLLYTVWEMKLIQEEIAPLATAIAMVTGRNPEDEKDTSRFGGAEQLGAVARLIKILGNAGLEEKGEAPDLTDKWILKNIKPGMIIGYALAAYAVINDGNKIEQTAPAEEQGPVDEGLEEEIEKKQPGK